MKNMPYRYIADTYAWIAYFNKKRFQGIIDHNVIETPSIVIAELLRTLIRKGWDKESLDKVLEFIVQKGPVLELGFYEAVNAGKQMEKEGLNFVGGIVYSYIENEDDRLLSGDEHFRDKPNVIFEKE